MDQFDVYDDMLMSPEFALDDSDSDDTLDSLMEDSTSPGRSSRKRSPKPCKYVPHAEKPVHLVQKRNARERRRVQAVNSAFLKLRKIVPYENKQKRLSKVKTLRTAIDYIRQLQDLIQTSDGPQQPPPHHPQPAVYQSASPPSYPENSRWMYHPDLQQQQYHQDNRLPSYCSNDDSSGQWTSNYSDSYHQPLPNHPTDHYSHSMTIHGQYGYLQGSSAMYTQRAVAHLASVS